MAIIVAKTRGTIILLRMYKIVNKANMPIKKMVTFA
jgi:hypothetical protein